MIISTSSKPSGVYHLTFGRLKSHLDQLVKMAWNREMGFQKMGMHLNSHNSNIRPLFPVTYNSPFPLPAHFPYFQPGHEHYLDCKKVFAGATWALFHHCKSHQISKPEQEENISVRFQCDFRNREVVWPGGFRLLNLKMTSNEEGFIYPYAQMTSHLFEFTFQDRTLSFLVRDKDFNLPIPRLHAFLDGNETEITNPPHHYHPGHGDPKGGSDDIFPKEHWNTWRTYATETMSEFRDDLYPMFETVFGRVCTHFNHRKIRVLDLGGADGELSFILLRKYQEIRRVYLLERSQLVYDALAKSHSSPAGKKMKAIQVDLIKSNLQHILRGHKVDVILMASLVAKSVMDREEARDLLYESKKVLKRDGLILICSYSNPHFEAKDYKEMGYTVLNHSMTYVAKERGNLICRAFYVLRRAF